MAKILSSMLYQAVGGKIILGWVTFLGYVTLTSQGNFTQTDVVYSHLDKTNLVSTAHPSAKILDSSICKQNKDILFLVIKYLTREKGILDLKLVLQKLFLYTVQKTN